MSPVIKITLEDKGQDFLEWYVRDGIVIDCQPSQGAVWVGSRVQMDGDRLIVELRGDDAPRPAALAYRAINLETLKADEAALVEGFGRKWANIIGIKAEDLGLAA